MTNNDFTKMALLRFLKERKLFKRYENAVHKKINYKGCAIRNISTVGKAFDMVIKTYGGRQLLNYTIVWGETDEGALFWSKYNTECNHFLKNLEILKGGEIHMMVKKEHRYGAR